VLHGNPNVNPQPESYWGSVNPSAQAPATTKASAVRRRSSSIIGSQHSLRIKIARVFNTYGPRMRPDDGRVVSNFLVQALHG
jgi:UDP-glucuronate decarboxylase